MQTTIKNLSDTKLELTVVASSEQLQKAKEATLALLAKDMKLPGFRPGKAPLGVVEKNANPATLQSEFLERAINMVYADVIDDKKIRPVSQPEVKISKFVPFDTLEIVFEVEAVGQITLPDYTKIKLKKDTIKITDKDIEGVLGELRKREADRKDVTRAAKNGDQVWIDFKGVDAKSKEAIKGADGVDYPLTLGSGAFIPGFEDNVVGMKAGEEKTFTITFPKDYGVKTLQNQKVDFTVKVTKVQELSEPKVDDAFAAKVGPFKTVKELKDDVKKQLEAEKENQVNRDFADKVLLEITAKTKIAVPQALIDEQIDRLVAEQKRNLVYRGLTWQEFLESEGTDEAGYRKKQQPDAELRVKAGLVLGEIAEAEKITLTPEEVSARIQLLKAQYPDKQMQAELDKLESRRDIASRMLSEKTIDRIVSLAAAK